MGLAAYKVIRYQSGWGVEHDGAAKGPYETKEAAFEDSVAAASHRAGPRPGHMSLGSLFGFRLFEILSCLDQPY